MNRHIPTLLLCAFLLVLAGCGSNAGAARPRVKPQHHATAAPTFVPSTTTEAIATPTLTPVAATPTATSVPAATPTPSPVAPTATSPPPAAAPEVVSASLSPTSPAAGATLQARVQVRGRASRLELYLAAGPGGGTPLTFTLSPLGSGLWGASGTAPTTPGTYHYSVGVYSPAGQRTVADNDAWNITVVGAPQQTGPQPLPDNVPLAPPFSYGNPQAAVFSAEGRTVNGSEVASNARPDVAASVVAQWYEIHFPRAGWSVDPSTVPGPGAASFSIVATGGNQVCVASYSGGVVQIFYGSLSS